MHSNPNIVPAFLQMKLNVPSVLNRQLWPKLLHISHAAEVWAGFGPVGIGLIMGNFGEQFFNVFMGKTFFDPIFFFENSVGSSLKSKENK